MARFLEDMLPVYVCGTRMQVASGLVRYSLRSRVYHGQGESEAWYIIDLHAGLRGDTTFLYLWVPTPGPSGKHRGPLKEFPSCPLEELLAAGRDDVGDTSETGYLLHWQKARYVTAHWLTGLLAGIEQSCYLEAGVNKWLPTWWVIRGAHWSVGGSVLGLTKKFN
jgi:hypothetical protein